MHPCGRLVVLVVVLAWLACVKADQYQWKPVFHLGPEKNWMNDPNGPLFYNEIYHMFFQYNPYGNTWGNMSWYHAVSPNLIQWKRIGVALSPSQPSDGAGVYSGSAFVSPGSGPPLLVYTGSANGSLAQTQCIAAPESNDKYLTKWKKSRSNPIVTSPPGSHIPSTYFRDPSPVVSRDGKDYMVVGGSVDNHTLGTIWLYSVSKDLLNWTSHGQLWESITSVPKTFMWECPDLHFVGSHGNQCILKLSDNAAFRDYWVVGECDDEMKFKGDPKRISFVDYGWRFYASKTLEAPTYNGSRIIFGWINEDRLKSTPISNWAGVMSLPRVVSVRNGEILQHPLSLSSLYVGNTINYNGEISPLPLLLAPSAGVHFRASVKIIHELHSSFGMSILGGEGYETIVSVKKIGSSISITVDRTNSGTLGNSTIESSGLFDTVGSYGQELEVFVDGSVVEVFFEGRALSTRIYPRKANAYELKLFTTSGEMFVDADFNVIKSAY